MSHFPLSILIPCFNEAQHVEAMAQELAKFKTVWIKPFEVIIIDDGSTDKTVAKIAENPFFQELRKSDQLKIIVSERNFGKGAALKTGVAAAQGEFILTLDADMATSPLDLLTWLKTNTGKFPQNEIWIGSREHTQSEVQDKFIRRLAGRVFNLIIRTLTPLNLQDSQCGFKFYPANLAKKLFSELQTLGWAHDVELLLLARKHKITVISLPINWEAKEESKINLVKDSVGMLAELFRIRQQLK